MHSEYHKIFTPFVRNQDRSSPDYNKLIPGSWNLPEFGYLQALDWVWTEKVDGVNIRVMWDGEGNITYGGRTDDAQISAKLINRLRNIFDDTVVFEKFFSGKEVTLFGEGYGGSIQGGHTYREDEDFILFDVVINGWWLNRPSVQNVAAHFDIESVPVLLEGSIWRAIYFVESDPFSHINHARHIEGVVGVPEVQLFNRAGERIITKVKAVDFK